MEEKRDTSKSTNSYAQFQRIQVEEKNNEHIKIYMDGSKKDEKVGCVVITPDQKFRKRLKVIIKTIYVSQQTSERRVFITDSLSKLMTVEGNSNSKNLKTLSLRRLLD
jgi:uncharacterized protein with PIN domain